MEQVLDVYKRPYDPRHPVVCMDESPRQLIRETRLPLAAGPGAPARHDFEYERCGVCNVFMAVEPLASKRTVQIRERRTKTDWAHFLNDMARPYPCAEKITLVMDNLNTHGPGSLYERFELDVAKALWDRFEFVYTPKHGKLAQHGRDRTQRPQQAMPGPQDRQSRPDPGRSGSLAEATKQRQVTNRLAVYQSRCPNQLKRLYPTLNV